MRFTVRQNLPRSIGGRNERQATVATHRAKITTAAVDFVFGMRDALGDPPLAPVAQEEDFLIEFVDRRGVLRRYVFRTFSEFFHVIRDAAVPVDGRDAGHE